MKVAISCDHGGFELKQEILNLLKEMNISYEDFQSFMKIVQLIIQIMHSKYQRLSQQNFNVEF